jgi:hypothetical protein
MPTIDLHDTPYEGRTSRPGASIVASEPTCTRCGTPLCGSLVEIRREKAFSLWMYECRCGRRRRLRREAGR